MRGMSRLVSARRIAGSTCANFSSKPEKNWRFSRQAHCIAESVAHRPMKPGDFDAYSSDSCLRIWKNLENNRKTPRGASSQQHPMAVPQERAGAHEQWQ
ncbi:MAG: hypothetical protein R3C52_10425 [Hyphomonadaceae bacterium]